VSNFVHDDHFSKEVVVQMVEDVNTSETAQNIAELNPVGEADDVREKTESDGIVACDSASCAVIHTEEENRELSFSESEISPSKRSSTTTTVSSGVLRCVFCEKGFDTVMSMHMHALKHKVDYYWKPSESRASYCCKRCGTLLDLDAVLASESRMCPCRSGGVKGRVKNISVSKVQKIPVVSKVQKMPVVTKIKKIPIVSEVQKNPVVSKVQKLPVVLKVQEIPIVSKLQKNPVVSKAPKIPVVSEIQKNPVVLDIQQNPVVSEVQKIPVVSQVQEILDVKEVQEIPIVSKVQKIPALSKELKLPGVTKAQKIPVVSKAQEIPVISKKVKKNPRYTPSLKCALCEASYATTSNLARHTRHVHSIQYRHSTQPATRYACLKCDRAIDVEECVAADNWTCACTDNTVSFEESERDSEEEEDNSKQNKREINKSKAEEKKSSVTARKSNADVNKSKGDTRKSKMVNKTDLKKECKSKDSKAMPRLGRTISTAGKIKSKVEKSISTAGRRKTKVVDAASLKPLASPSVSGRKRTVQRRTSTRPNRGQKCVGSSPEPSKRVKKDVNEQLAILPSVSATVKSYRGKSKVSKLEQRGLESRNKKTESVNATSAQTNLSDAALSTASVKSSRGKSKASNLKECKSETDKIDSENVNSAESVGLSSLATEVESLRGSAKVFKSDARRRTRGSGDYINIKSVKKVLNSVLSSPAPTSAVKAQRGRPRIAKPVDSEMVGSRIDSEDVESMMEDMKSSRRTDSSKKVAASIIDETPESLQGSDFTKTSVSCDGCVDQKDFEMTDTSVSGATYGHDVTRPVETTTTLSRYPKVMSILSETLHGSDVSGPPVSEDTGHNGDVTTLMGSMVTRLDDSGTDTPLLVESVEIAPAYLLSLSEVSCDVTRPSVSEMTWPNCDVTRPLTSSEVNSRSCDEVETPGFLEIRGESTRVRGNESGVTVECVTGNESGVTVKGVTLKDQATADAVQCSGAEHVSEVTNINHSKIVHSAIPDTESFFTTPYALICDGDNCIDDEMNGVDDDSRKEDENDGFRDNDLEHKGKELEDKDNESEDKDKKDEEADSEDKEEVDKDCDSKEKDEKDKDNDSDDRNGKDENKEDENNDQEDKDENRTNDTGNINKDPDTGDKDRDIKDNDTRYKDDEEKNNDTGECDTYNNKGTVTDDTDNGNKYNGTDDTDGGTEDIRNLNVDDDISDKDKDTESIERDSTVNGKQKYNGTKNTDHNYTRQRRDQDDDAEYLVGDNVDSVVEECPSVDDEWESIDELNTDRHCVATPSLSTANTDVVRITDAPIFISPDGAILSQTSAAQGSAENTRSAEGACASTYIKINVVTERKVSIPASGVLNLTNLPLRYCAASDRGENLREDTSSSRPWEARCDTFEGGDSTEVKRKISCPLTNVVVIEHTHEDEGRSIRCTASNALPDITSDDAWISSSEKDVSVSEETVMSSLPSVVEVTDYSKCMYNCI